MDYARAPPASAIIAARMDIQIAFIFKTLCADYTRLPLLPHARRNHFKRTQA